MLHDALRRHYYFTQGDDDDPVRFFICEPRFRWSRRPTEYVVAWGDLGPTRVSREQFVNLNLRFHAEGVVTLDDVEREEDDGE